MIERVLLPLDGTGPANTILPRLRATFAHLGATVTVLRVIPTYADGEEGPRSRRQAGHAAHVLEGAGIEAEARVEEGPVVETIDRVAEEVGAGLIAISTHHHSAIDQWMAPTTAEKLLRASRVPLLVVPPGESPGPKGFPYRRILVPYDGSIEGLAVANPVVEAAKRLGCEVMVLHALPKSASQEQRMAARSALDRMQRRFDLLGLRVRTRLERGEPAEVLHGVVERDECDWIAMTSHGREGWARLVEGSVANDLLRGIDVPVLVVRSRTRADVPSLSTPTQNPDAWEQTRRKD